HWENLRMGYQIVFMMNLAFAAILLRVIVLTNRANLLRRGVEAGLTTLLLLGCGAGGLAFGPFMAIWLVALAYGICRGVTATGARAFGWGAAAGCTESHIDLAQRSWRMPTPST